MSKTILIVDDDQGSLNLYTMFFQSKGYEVLVAVDGRHALEALDRHEVDLLLLDLDLPEVQGEDIMAAMVDHPVWKAIPVIIDSAVSPESGRKERIKERFYDKLRYIYFQRPSSLEQIDAAIQFLDA